ncbi:hypothetical protein [[Eubacterium] hominis]|uniref:hypothetical protein n=1 Tax=[Eubacterium] hominis TaxID=2764325 RepID=UPI003A4DFCBF
MMHEKGIVLNLVLIQLVQVDLELAELLCQREDFEKIDDAFQQVKHQYQLMQDTISELLYQGQ